MSKKLLFTIGLPFSGKSTLAAEYAQKGWKIINRDDLLKDIVASEEFRLREQQELDGHSTDPGEVFNIRNRIASEMLTAAVQEKVLDNEDENLFYDGTNLQSELRHGLLDLKDKGVSVGAVYLKVPIEEIVERARKVYKTGERQEQFNEGALENLRLMAQMFEEPSENEGYDNFAVIEPEAELKQEFKLR